MRAPRSIRARASVLLLIAAGFLAACHRDPRQEALRSGVSLVVQILRSRVLRDAVANVDPRSRPKTAADAALKVGVVANFPPPPDGIAVVPGDRPTRPWCVILVGDDDEGRVRVLGYAQDLTEPAIVEEVPFPPR